MSLRVRLTFAVTASLVFGVLWVAPAMMIPGGGSRRTDCIIQLAASGTPFPAGRRQALGATCRDGDPCDQDGTPNGVCRFSIAVCINTRDDALARCRASDVARIRVKHRRQRAPGGLVTDVSVLEDAVRELGLPSGEDRCSMPRDIEVAVGGPDRRGDVRSGEADLRFRARTSRGRRDADRYLLVCREAGTSTTTVPPPGRRTPGAGLVAEILGASVSTAGTVQVTFKLTDAEGVPVEPTLDATIDPDQARVRITLARLEVLDGTLEGFTTTFTRYRNYITTRQTSPITGNSADQPTYDPGGTFVPADSAAGTYVYTIGTMLPAGFPATLTHTVGAQIERTFEGERLIANPIFDFVPAGGTPTAVREVTTTAQCNSCHNPLALHGGGRREVRLCQLCHTDQAVDPDTGNAIEFKVMVHKIHRGKELPSLEEGPVGTKYAIVGFRQTELVFGERVRLCRGGAHASAQCATDADCPGGTCVDEIHTCAGGTRGGLTCVTDDDCPTSTCSTTIKTEGVGFPQDIRNCEKCHGEGATAANYRERPSAAACASCHDTLNPGEAELNGLAPGTGHLAGPQPDAFCRLCHTPTGEEFGISVMGAHTIPLRSAELAGLRGEIVSASGTPGGPVTVSFRITDGSGTPLPSLTDMNRVAFAVSGPTSDLGGASKVRITPTAVGAGATGTVAGPDAGVYTYIFAAADSLPEDARGTWRIGMEARRLITVGEGTVGEVVQNPVLDFSVDGSPVEPRRTVVDIANCQRCHGVFSETFLIHGGVRNQTEYCVICHNPNVNDFARRSRTFCAVTCGANKVADTTATGDDVQLIAAGASCASTDSCVIALAADTMACEDDATMCVADTAAAGDDLQRIDVGFGAANPANQPIHFKRLIHRIHTGEEGEHQPYTVYGFGPAPRGFGAFDFGGIRFPGDRRDCDTCHVDESYLLPLPADVLPTRAARVVLNPDPTMWATAPFVESTSGLSPIPPIQAACRACHDGDDAAAHAATMTTPEGAEACAVCHGEGKIVAVSEVHAR